MYIWMVRTSQKQEFSFLGNSWKNRRLRSVAWM
jgi:hypothetical protein